MFSWVTNSITEMSNTLKNIFMSHGNVRAGITDELLQYLISSDLFKIILLVENCGNFDAPFGAGEWIRSKKRTLNFLEREVFRGILFFSFFSYLSVKRLGWYSHFRIHGNKGNYGDSKRRRLEKECSLTLFPTRNWKPILVLLWWAGNGWRGAYRDLEC